jgi:DNA-binding XRE family transcriptional regulator
MNRLELRTWRREHWLTQTELGALLSVDKMTVYRWESGQTEFPAYLSLALERLDVVLGEAMPNHRNVA